ncbi:MAG: T9SS type A sorting domain-containing protein [Saprospiraceae bacterium]
MKPTILLNMLALCTLIATAGTSARAQAIFDLEVVATAGGCENSGNFLLDWTLGELAVETLDGNALLTQGFHQGGSGVNPTVEIAGKSFEVALFPNPANEYFFVEHGYPGTLMLQLYNAFGQLVLTQTLDSPVTQVKTAHLPPATYYGNLRSTAGQHLYAFKILKTAF